MCISGAAERAARRTGDGRGRPASSSERDAGLALLFAPPFDRTPLDPGYIKGYPPGMRENGGQYTHAATWSVIAFALLGQADKAAELFSLLNPVNRTTTRADVHRYKVEPYVVAADIYSVAPHVGRGGWTWYTGSAGWMYRAGLESILGFHLQGNRLRLEPCIPAHWPGFEIAFKYRTSRYEIRVENPAPRQSWNRFHGAGRSSADWKPHGNSAGERRRNSPRADCPGGSPDVTSVPGWRAVAR